MTNDNQEKVLRFMLEKTGSAIIRVKGYSMFPELSEGDNISLRKFQEYNIGDVLVYNYNGDGLLVHRLLSINDLFVCKGDYAFRFEKINPSEIIGKVTLINGRTIKSWDSWKINLSYEIGKMYSECNSVEEVKNTSLYKLYYAVVLKEQPEPFIFCSEMYKYISFNHNHLACKCIQSDGHSEEYYDIDSNIIFMANQRLSINLFFKKLYGLYPCIDQCLENIIFARLCSLIRKQVVTIR